MQRPESKERSRQRVAKWSNTPKGKAYHKKWYVENREYILQVAKEYHAKPEIKLKERKRVLLLKYGENGLLVFKRDLFQCKKCKNTKKLEVHHIDWNNKNNELENLVVLCEGCHHNIHRFIPLEYRLPFYELWFKMSNGELNYESSN